MISSSNTYIESIGIIGKSNQILYLLNYTNDISDMDIIDNIDICLDIIEDKMTRTNDSYLGLIHFMDDFGIYGYCTNTMIKFLITIKYDNRPPKENIIKNVKKYYLYLVAI